MHNRLSRSMSNLFLKWAKSCVFSKAVGHRQNESNRKLYACARVLTRYRCVNSC